MTSRQKKKKTKKDLGIPLPLRTAIEKEEICVFPKDLAKM